MFHILSKWNYSTNLPKKITAVLSISETTQKSIRYKLIIMFLRIFVNQYLK